MDDAQGGRGTNTRTTLVEEGTAFRGTFSSDCPIVVKGKIEGDVTGPSLTVSSTGAVAGTVKVGVIESEGELSGEFEAEVVRLSGRVRDNTVIRAKSLEVKLAPENGMLQVIFGECALDVGDMPTKEEALGVAQAASSPAVPSVDQPEQPPMVEALPAKPAEKIPALPAANLVAPPGGQLAAPAADMTAAPAADLTVAAAADMTAAAAADMTAGPAADMTAAAAADMTAAATADMTAAATADTRSAPVDASQKALGAMDAAPSRREVEKQERRNSPRGRGGAVRTSTMPPPPH